MNARTHYEEAKAHLEKADDPLKNPYAEIGRATVHALLALFLTLERVGR